MYSTDRQTRFKALHPGLGIEDAFGVSKLESVNSVVPMGMAWHEGNRSSGESSVKRAASTDPIVIREISDFFRLVYQPELSIGHNTQGEPPEGLSAVMSSLIRAGDAGQGGSRPGTGGGGTALN